MAGAGLLALGGSCASAGCWSEAWSAERAWRRLACCLRGRRRCRLGQDRCGGEAWLRADCWGCGWIAGGWPSAGVREGTG
ncbi:hypothetical protein B0J12DRAFT_692263 [Macrophomina phaseolina]|uniref:Secreted protein n=1 Tax=Macrophomina phaseolina TaxID=35725 RepID=A0ABQ8FPJ6_9PEZI|nr:hypothetical protein B0J12DRAFT_692263 [Macrophomina phaseolina]